MSGEQWAVVLFVLVVGGSCAVALVSEWLDRRRKWAAYRQHWDAEPLDARYWITGVWICPDALCGSFVAWSAYDDDDAIELEIEEHERRVHGIE